MALTQTPEEGLKVSNAPSDGKFLQYKDGTDKLTWAEVSQTGGATGVDYNDDVKVRFGTGNDLEIYHDPDTSIIKAPDGDLHIRADNFQLISDDTAGRAIYLDNSNSLLELGFDGNHDAHFKGDGVEFLHDVQLNAQKDLRFADADSSNYVAFQAPTTIASNYTITLPAAVPTDNGQALTSTTAGVTSWATISSDPTTTSGTNNFTVADGNLVIGTAGHGIDFSAVGAGSSVSADENILDDYECGTWTPSVVTGTLGSGTEGYYVKVGNVVHVNGRLETWSDTTSGQPIIMNVRPFAAARAEQVPMAAHMLHFSTGSGLNMSFHFHNNNWYIIYGQTNAGQSYFQHSDIQSSSCSITFSGSYIIA